MKNFQNREVRVFISSTFRGMYYDRKALVDHVFPEIRRRCSERGIGFTEVDLRWGITNEEVDKGLATPICFQQIDNCQPFFVGLLGEYYGSTILPEQIKAACAAYPWIAQGYLNRSITELEIIHALNNDEQQALFYFRDPNSADSVPETDSEKRAKQQNLKQRLRDKGCHIEIYNQADDLKSLVIEPLWEKISNKFPDVTAEQKLNFEHDAFANSRQRVYIKRQTDFDRLSQHAQSDDAPLIIYGESGSGKTALLANWAEEYKKTDPDELVIWHFCGSSADSTNPIELLRRIMLNLKSHHMEEELPTTPEAIKEQFGEWLAKATSPVILIIDGINQLQETEITRGWLHYIPAKTRLLLSTISAENLPAEWQKWELALLTEKSARQALITEYLQWAARQGLNEAELLKILNIPQAPLYLALQNFLISNGGLLNFFHDCLKQAVENRYLSSSEDQQQWHLRLANYFDQQQLDSRVANELPWQLQQAGEKERLRSCISDIRMFLQLDQDNREYELWGYWLELEPDKTMVGAYNDNLAKYEENEQLESDKLSYVLNQLGLFFQKAGYFSEAISLQQRALSIREKVLGKEHPYTANSLGNLGSLYYVKGEYDSAEPLYQRCLEIHEKILDKEHPEMASSLNNFF